MNDVKPQTSATDLVNVLLGGRLRAGNEWSFPNGEQARAKYNDIDDGITVLLVDKQERHEWAFSVDTGQFRRIK